MRGERLHKLFVEDLRDLYDAEKQLLKALPKMAKAATHPQVQSAIDDHVAVTREQVARLEKVFESLGQPARAKACPGMAGIIKEGDEHLNEGLEEGIVDSALIGSGQKIEHYEIAGYNAVIEMADLMGHKQASRLLRQTLREEERMSKKLTQVSARLAREAMKEMQRTERAKAA